MGSNCPRCGAYGVYVCICPRYRKPYTGFNFLVDLILTAITHGAWLIWIFVREMRKR